ncbi:MAG: YcaO-like family protein [Desulfovibrionales bacterium]|nr:YcaO-like family protein [Desulfovibrionales bacterium]
MNTLLHYSLKHQETQLGVAYFSPTPPETMTQEQCLEYIVDHPLDEFMRGHLRELLAHTDEANLRAMFDQQGTIVRGLILETLLLTPTLKHLWVEFQKVLQQDGPALAQSTPQRFLSSVLLPDHHVHAQASASIRKNIFEHAPLPKLSRHAFLAAKAMVPNDVAKIKADLAIPLPCPRRPVQETYALAMEKLYGLGIVDGPEMRHQASLAPWGLLRRWRLNRTISCGSFAYRLDGILTGYGRGFTLNQARASLAMEMIERYSSFASIKDMTIANNRGPDKITLAPASKLQTPALDLHTLCMEVPYADQPLYWMEAMDTNEQTVLVPLQCVYLFSNLDEIQLFSALGSTGLASGNTPEEAKVSGLTEIIERDCELTSVFTDQQCFRLTSRNPEAAELLAAHQAQGIDVIFQNLTSEIGVPCYKSFVRTKEGTLIKATGAGLSGQRAALSALTETPYPYPHGPSSAQGPDLPMRSLEDLPDYSTGSARGDLFLLEALLKEQGYHPLYANLTKKEVGLPVYRCLVPGLEIATDFDQFSRISPRIWRSVLQGMT